MFNIVTFSTGKEIHTFEHHFIVFIPEHFIHNTPIRIESYKVERNKSSLMLKV